jgi:hypothetical protein
MIHDGKSRKLPFDPDEAIAHLRAVAPGSSPVSTSRYRESGCEAR